MAGKVYFGKIFDTGRVVGVDRRLNTKTTPGAMQWCRGEGLKIRSFNYTLPVSVFSSWTDEGFTRVTS